MRPNINKLTHWTAISIAALSVVLILLTAAAITTNALTAALATAGTQVPIWLAMAAKATPVNGIALAASAAAGIAAILAATHRFGLFRESDPHLSVTQTIHTQELGESYRLVAVTTVLHNKSKVLVNPTRAWCRLAQTKPLTDERVQAIFDDALISDSEDPQEQFAWPILAQAEKTWDPGEMTIEPNEDSPVVFQFIIGRKTDAVHITTAIIRPDQSEPKENHPETQLPPMAWMCYTFYELPSQSDLRKDNAHERFE